MADKDEGKTFSEVYVERGIPSADSSLLRGRLGMYLERKLPLAFQIAVTNDLSTYWGRPIIQQNIGSVFKDLQVVTTLNAVTYVFRALEARSIEQAKQWLSFVNSVFCEENLTYRVDSKGGVRLFPDQEFESSRAATIARLKGPKFATVLQNYDLALEDLKTPAQVGEAIRHTFDALENLAKLILGDKISRLGPSEIDKHLRTSVLSSLSGVERDAASQFLESVKSWVNAAQQYRHAPGTEVPQPPSIDFAIAMVSAGASYLRWLAKLSDT